MNTKCKKTNFALKLFRPTLCLLFVSTNLGLFSTGCKKAKTDYPVAYTLTDPNSGKSIPVNITGRTSGHVEFIRLKDSKFFSYPVGKLSNKDKRFVERLRLIKTDDKLVPAISKNNPSYVQTRLERIEELNKDISRLKLEIGGERHNPGMQQKHSRQILEKQSEISELNQDIKRYQTEH